MECVGRAEPPQRNEGPKKKTQKKTLTDLKLILDYSVPFSIFSDYSLDTLHLSLM